METISDHARSTSISSDHPSVPSTASNVLSDGRLRNSDMAVSVLSPPIPRDRRRESASLRSLAEMSATDSNDANLAASSSRPDATADLMQRIILSVLLPLMETYSS